MKTHKNRLFTTALVSMLSLVLFAAADTQPAPAKPNDDGFITSFVLLEPIDLKEVSDHTEEIEKPMFAKDYFTNQSTATPKDKDKVKTDAGELIWHDYKITDGNQIDFVQFATDNKKESDAQLFLGVAYINCTEDIKDVKLAIGSDDSSVWTLDGKEVIRVYAGRGVGEDDDVSKPLTLHKGVNILRFSVINGDAGSGACARFLDAKDQPIKNFTVTTTPPAK